MQKNDNATQVINQIFKAFKTGNTSELLKTISEDSLWIYKGPEELPYTGEYKGKKGVESFITGISAYVEVLDFQIFKIVSDGETVFVSGLEKQRIKSNDKILEQKWVQIYTVKDGLITSMEEFADTAYALELFQSKAQHS